MADKQPKKKYEPTHKYLAIKNWHKYQADRKGREIKAWVKDYCGKDIDDPQYNSLTQAQRYLFDGCCRVRGRSGRNLSSDPAWVSRALGIIPKERSSVPSNLLALTTLGFLIPTNQQVDASETQSESEEETETQVPPPVAAVSSLASRESQNPVQGSVAETTPTPKATASTDLRDWSEPIPGCDLPPKRIADCIRYQLDVKKNDYFIKRMSRGYVLQEWKRLDRDTPEDYVYDPDPLWKETTIPGVGDEPPITTKKLRRDPKNDAERKQLQKYGDKYREKLYQPGCEHNCKEVWSRYRTIPMIQSIGF